MSTSRYTSACVFAGTLLACNADPGSHVLAPRLDAVQASEEVSALEGASGPAATGHGDVIQQPSGELEALLEMTGEVESIRERARERRRRLGLG